MPRPCCSRRAGASAWIDLAGNLVALLVHGGEGFPRIGTGLLDTQRDATTLFIDVQHHHFGLVTDLNHLGGVDVLVGPVHFGHVDQAFDARLDRSLTMGTDETHHHLVW